MRILLPLVSSDYLRGIVHVGLRRLMIGFVVAGVVALLAPMAAAAATTVNVNTTADTVPVNPAVSCLDSSGNCSLRGAIIEADTQGGDFTINVPAGTYKLTIPPTGTDDSDTGDLNITDTTGTVTIAGAGPA